MTSEMANLIGYVFVFIMMCTTKIKEFLKALEAHDDVQQIWTNANLDQN